MDVLQLYANSQFWGSDDKDSDKDFSPISGTIQYNKYLHRDTYKIL